MRTGRNTTRAVASRVVATLVVLSVAATSFAFVERRVRAASTEITGVVRLAGCPAGSGHVVDVGALPFAVGRPAAPAADPMADVPSGTPLLTTKRTRAVPGDIAGTYRFVLTGLAENVPYLVTPRLSSRGCRTAMTKSSAQVAFAGSILDMTIAAVPATLDVHICPEPGGDVCHNGEENWRRTAYVPKTDIGSMTRTFRTFAFGPQAVRARWEVAQHPMSDACAPADRRIMEGTITYDNVFPSDGGPEGASRHTRFSVSFRDVILKKQFIDAAVGGSVIGSANPLDTVGGLLPNAGVTAAATKAIKPGIKNLAGVVDRTKQTVAKTVDPAYVVDNDVYFVRVVPLDAAGNCIAAASNRVAVKLKDPEPVVIPAQAVMKADFAGHVPFRLGSRDHSQFFYQATSAPPASETGKWSKAFGGISNIPKPGEHFVLIPIVPEKDLFDHVAEFGEGFVNAVGSAVDWIATAWQDIKDWAIDQAATAIDNWVPLIDCSAPCRAGLKIGLDIALSSMGIPPSIPNFKELVENGEDYLIDKMLQEAGVPDVPCVENVPCPRQEIEKLIDEKLIPEAEKLQSSKAKGGLGWAMPEGFEKPSPSTVTVAVTNVGPVTVPARACADWSTTWVDQCVWLAPLRPGQTKRVTLALDARDIVHERHRMLQHPKYAAHSKLELDGLWSVLVYKIPKSCEGYVDFTLSAWPAHTNVATTSPAEGFVDCRSD